MSVFPKIKTFGENAVLLEWEKEISHAVHVEVIKYQRHINKAFNNQIVEIVPTYCSLVVYLKDTINQDVFINMLNSEIIFDEIIQKEQIVIYVPVCYDLKFGVDLPDMSQQLKMPIDEIIKRHTAVEYSLFFLGFLPGFPYLGGLDPALEINRRATPRSLVAAGSVGIAGKQTGIYTMDSPGGWNIIGKSPLTFFDVHKKKPNLLRAGDKIRFFSVSIAEFEAIKASLINGTYRLKTEIIDA